MWYRLRRGAQEANPLLRTALRRDNISVLNRAARKSKKIAALLPIRLGHGLELRAARRAGEAAAAARRRAADGSLSDGGTLFRSEDCRARKTFCPAGPRALHCAFDLEAYSRPSRADWHV